MISTSAHTRIALAFFSLVLAMNLVVPTLARAQECIQDSGCADDDVCNGIERCDATVCVASAAIPCNDGDSCTHDDCDPTIGCSHREELCPTDCTGLLNGDRCVDGSVCTVSDSCNGGVCVPGAPRECVDVDECTAAVCDPLFGCLYTEVVVSPPCASDCSGGVADFTRCTGDDNPCTIDACLPSVDFSVDKCVDNLLLSRQCADDDVCNGVEWCSPVLGCQANAPLDCDDDDACNGLETCDPSTGCQSGTPLVDGEPCDDGRDCTGGDLCAAEACSGTPLTPALCDDAELGTADQCHEGFGCLHCAPLEAQTLGLKLAAPSSPNGKLRTKARISLESAAVAIAAEPFTLIVTHGTAETYRATLPPAAIGAQGSGRYRFVDRTGLLANGLRSLAITERDGVLTWRSSSAKLSVTGPLDMTASLVVVVGDDCFSNVLYCSANGTGTRVKCSPP